MDAQTQTRVNNLYSEDRQLQNDAFFAVLAATDKPVDWAYDVWGDLLAGLTSADNHDRAIAAQVLCNLAKSDPDRRMLKDLDALLAVTKDPRFVTARHAMQALWKVGAAGQPQRAKLVDGLAIRFKECVTEKNGSLIRSDILRSLRNVYDAVKDEAVKDKALALIETETDLKYRKKYALIWKMK